MIVGQTYLKDSVGTRAKGRTANLDPGYVADWGFPIWRDEFDQPTLDLTKWTNRDSSTHGNLSYDWAVIDDSTVSIVNDQMRIRATELATPVASGGKTRYWNTGYLDTMGKFSQQYGRWEMRAKIPTTRGNSRAIWPAFWLRNGSVGEIDIMESWGDPPVRARNVNLAETSTMTIHESTNGGADKLGWTYEPRAYPAKSLHDTASGFHTWTLELTPTFLKGYLDGILCVHVAATGEMVKGVARDFSWVWGPNFASSPWAIRLNMQIGDPYWSPDPTPSALTAMPADYIIDYVRAWEYTP